MSARAFRAPGGGLLCCLVILFAVAVDRPVAWAADGQWSNEYQFAPDSGVEQAAFRQRRRVCPPGWAPAESAAPASPMPSTEPAGPLGAIPPSALASAVGVAEGPSTATPNMIGDSLNNGFGGMRFFGSGILGPIITPHGATVGISGGDRRFKIAQDENPIPTDRVFFNFNHFQNPVMDIDGTKRNLDRYTFGLEKTFRDGLWSFVFRVPFASGYDATQSIMPGAGLAATEFGDMSLVLKRILIQRDRLAISAGLSTVFPSGDDFRITDNTGTLVEVWNQSVHLGPFVGMVLAPTDRLFFLGFGQLDFDTVGSTVLMRDGGGTPGSLAKQGVFHDQTRGFLDFTVGYRLYQNPCANILTAVTPMVELHYTSTLTDMDYVTGPLGSIGATAGGGTGRRDILNLTAGLHLQLGELSSLTFAGVAPLTNGLNREFDSEFLVQFNRRF